MTVTITLNSGTTPDLCPTTLHCRLDHAFDKGDGAVAALIVQHDKTLTKLSVPPTFTDEARCKVINALATHHSVASLDLSGVVIGEQVFKALVPLTLSTINCTRPLTLSIINCTRGCHRFPHVLA
jgi:hypothetical protein